MAPLSLLSGVFSGSSKRANKHYHRDRGQLSPVSIQKKTMQPAHVTQSSLATLSDDLILYILDILQDMSPKSILFCMSVCSSFYYHARHVRHRELSIDIGSNDSIERLGLASKNNLLPAVRTLKVSGNGQLPSTLGDTLQGMTGLRNVEWSAASITEPILQTLQSSPHTTLDIKITDNTKQLLAELPGSIVLSSVSVNITYATAEDCTQVTQPLKQVLLSCPNLRKLSLNLTRPSRGCVAPDPPAQYVGIGFAAGERPRPLQELRISSYPWGYRSPSPNGGGVNCIGYPEHGLEMDYWTDHFDWSCLALLEDASVIFAHKVVRKLTALKHVHFTYSQAPVDKQFFELVPSALESIHVPTLDSIGINSLAQHALSLRKLHIHQQQRQMDQWRDRIISNDNLTSICEILPQLREVGIDIARDGNDWPYTTLDILATLPRLQRLDLWFELGNARETVPTPYLAMAQASELFGYLRKRSSTLDCLYLHSGCPPPTSEFGFVTEESYWPTQNSTSFVCQPAENHDGAAQGLFSVTCPKLSDRLNHKAQCILRGKEDSAGFEEHGIDFRVALQGPIPLQEWMDLRNGKT
ncbi:hypothetical protein FZEAL_7693 [Fusarium zealandicum]|uniref:F-box domain-containing protein n=1 Tax=Fusarium zealandicum TaxID=1053134 RepID=A0A8H4UG86_9HYPO|nr:hypothetical protein FZEAL_7693 [Fusarium zealandicum]